jgi:hypothetical protein
MIFDRTPDRTVYYQAPHNYADRLILFDYNQHHRRTFMHTPGRMTVRTLSALTLFALLLGTLVVAVPRLTRAAATETPLDAPPIPPLFPGGPTPSQKQELFGSAVAINGDTAVVGAENLAYGGYANAGAAYVYQFNNGQWNLQQQLFASDYQDQIHTFFGSAVAISADTIVVGAGLHGGASAAYIFTRDANGL